MEVFKLHKGSIPLTMRDTLDFPSGQSGWFPEAFLPVIALR